jgi:hypothetical protein
MNCLLWALDQYANGQAQAHPIDSTKTHHSIIDYWLVPVAC